ncbi:MAG: M23 family metallopeptidase [Alphaproteobacteria bacterium]|nr:M23 family metallopeptidase [Alphaproteobacteria bacterium]
MDRSFAFILATLSALAAWATQVARPEPELGLLDPDSFTLEPPPRPLDWDALVPEADGFDWPVGPPAAQGYYDAQPFGRNDHLGEDWNGVGGGDSDLGDPVYALAHGWVSLAEDVGRGWGQVVRVVHRVPPEEPGGRAQVVESLYAHLDTIEVEVGDLVLRGQKLGSIGDAGGLYPAHLHLELRERPGMPVGGGYSRDTRGYLSPSAFITEHRPRAR